MPINYDAEIRRAGPVQGILWREASSTPMWLSEKGLQYHSGETGKSGKSGLQSITPRIFKQRLVKGHHRNWYSPRMRFRVLSATGHAL